jgi:hypothetical protein
MRNKFDKRPEGPASTTISALQAFRFLVDVGCRLHRQLTDIALVGLWKFLVKPLAFSFILTSTVLLK